MTALMEEVIMAARHIYDMDDAFELKQIRPLAEYVAEASGRGLEQHRPVIGEFMFTHESGIHADGVIKNPKNYEVFNPAEVGLTRQLVVGKHSGSHTILHKFKEYDIDLTDKEANDILALTRSMSVDLKRPLFDKELMYIYKDYKSSAKE